MKKRMILFLLALGLLALTACGPAEGVAPEDSPQPSGTAEPAGDSAPPSLEQEETPVYLACRIVDGADDGNLLLAALKEVLSDRQEEYALQDGKGVYRLTVDDSIPVYVDGEKAAAADLEDGMPVEIAFNGAVQEVYPAQFGEVYSVSAWTLGTEQNPGGTCYDLCGLYLQVLDDLWKKDPALNQDISVAGLDLSQAPGELLDSEKAALTWRFGETHGVEVVSGTHDELVEQGYMTVVPDDPEADGIPGVYWYDGCLFSITAHQTEEEEIYSLPVLRFDADKWCGPLAAYVFYDCTAVWPEMGSWSGYTVGDEMIS